jgi:hypothetical protein
VSAPLWRAHLNTRNERHRKIELHVEAWERRFLNML